jgi:Heterokaryon incompatibility protein (HET)
MALKHPYRPLDAPRDEIRLLPISPSRSNRAAVSCKLRHLRYAEDERVIWIDALCISQDDLAERNRHVNRMQNIYRKASKVVIWLGEASENSDLAFSFLMEVSRRRLEIGNWLPRVLLDASYEQSFRAFYDLADRNYRSCVWIIQEIFFGSSIIVRCGFRCIRWSDFVFFFTTVLSSPSLIVQLMTKMIEDPVKYMNLMYMIPGIIDRCHLPASIEKWKQMSEDEKGGLSLEVLLMSY